MRTCPSCSSYLSRTPTWRFSSVYMSGGMEYPVDAVRVADIELPPLLWIFAYRCLHIFLQGGCPSSLLGLQKLKFVELHDNALTSCNVLFSSCCSSLSPLCWIFFFCTDGAAAIRALMLCVGDFGLATQKPFVTVAGFERKSSPRYSNHLVI